MSVCMYINVSMYVCAYGERFHRSSLFVSSVFSYFHVKSYCHKPQTCFSILNMNNGTFSVDLIPETLPCLLIPQLATDCCSSNIQNIENVQENWFYENNRWLPSADWVFVSNNFYFYELLYIRN
ncbi:uncharacterized protein LOC105427268 [Pogonomyrmex barbatus]|uniref:Uncharacterized protein LOC105427268 n=1 Tax=Pogonomyrmex barbatus TaxID=144034 RepID=A0A6I9W5I2_9HYME|nr:uncharacterized protein LOC105427268 [Pogonomyrmex barbatus]